MTQIRQISPPPELHALSTLGRVDYTDTFVLETADADGRTAEQWARTALEDAPLTMRSRLLSGWSSIGLELGRGDSDRFVLGWEIRRSEPDVVLLGARSRIGMPGELLFKRDQGAVLFATFVEQGNPLARLVWSRIESVHVRTVRQLLEQAAARIEAGGRTVAAG